MKNKKAAIGFIFFLGMPFDPPLAGVIARTLILLSLEDMMLLEHDFD